MKILILSISLFLFYNCKENIKNDSSILLERKDVEQGKIYIDNIVINRFSTQEPANYDLDRYVSTVIFLDSISLIEYTYKKNVLSETKTVKSYKDIESSRMIFSKIPKKYLINEQVFDYHDGLDEEGVSVSINLRNGQNIFWKLGPREDGYPKEIQSFYRKYIKIQQKFDRIK